MKHRLLVPTSPAPMIAAAIVLLSVTPALHSQTTVPLEDLIEGLGSPAPQVRDESMQTLQQIGSPAQQALQQATHHPLPEISNRASMLLARLPFYVVDDSPEVKAVLFGYESDDLDGRSQRIRKLTAMQTTDARLALVRVARNEPIRILQWKAVAALATSDDPEVLEAMSAAPDEQEPCQLVLSAWVWRHKDASRADTLIRRAMEIERSVAPHSTEMATNLVPVLKQLQRPQIVRELFDWGYRPLHEQLMADPSSAERMNTLALYCARCSEELPQAFDLATRAVAAEPDNSAFIGTLAEVHFHRGELDEAIRLEQRALEIRPRDDTTRSQLERFMAAVE